MGFITNTLMPFYAMGCFDHGVYHSFMATFSWKLMNPIIQMGRVAWVAMDIMTWDGFSTQMVIMTGDDI